MSQAHDWTIHVTRTPTLRALSAGLVVAVSLGLAACGSGPAPTATGGSTDTTRRAAKQADPNGVCPEAEWSKTLTSRASEESMFVLNRLPSRVELRVPLASIDCDDWSGMFTPFAGLNGQTLNPGGERGIRLDYQVHPYADSPWNLEVKTLDTSPVIGGSVRLFLHAARQRDAYQALRGDPAVVPGRLDCRFERVGTSPAGWRDTPPADYSRDDDRYRRPQQDVFTLAVVDGKVSMVNCGPHTSR